MPRSPTPDAPQPPVPPGPPHPPGPSHPVPPDPAVPPHPMDDRGESPVGWQRPRMVVPPLDVSAVRAYGERGYEEAERFFYVRALSESDTARMSAAEARYEAPRFEKLIAMCHEHPELLLPEHMVILTDLQRQLAEAEAIRHRERTYLEVGRLLGYTRLVRSAGVVELAETLAQRIIDLVDREREGLSPSLHALSASVDFRDLVERAKASRLRTKEVKEAARDENKDLIERLTNEVGQLRAALEQAQRDQTALRNHLLQNGLQPPAPPAPPAPSSRRTTDRR